VGISPQYFTFFSMNSGRITPILRVSRELLSEAIKHFLKNSPVKAGAFSVKRLMEARHCSEQRTATPAV
jgi:hypothetical protein